MAKRHRLRAKIRLAALIQQLGGFCVKCGSSTHLQINHIYKTNWVREKRDPSWRVSTYYAEATLGLLNVLCRKCNKKYKPLPPPDEDLFSKTDAPF